MHAVMELLQLAIDEVYRRHERLAELRRKARTWEEEEEAQLICDRMTSLLARAGARDALDLASKGESVVERYKAWNENGRGSFLLFRSKRSQGGTQCKR
jgi:hypothetical protein